MAKESGLAANTYTNEVLVAYVDSTNPGGFIDPITQQGALSVLMGRSTMPPRWRPRASRLSSSAARRGPLAV